MEGSHRFLWKLLVPDCIVQYILGIPYNIFLLFVYFFWWSKKFLCGKWGGGTVARRRAKWSDRSANGSKWQAIINRERGTTITRSRPTSISLSLPPVATGREKSNRGQGKGSRISPPFFFCLEKNLSPSPEVYLNQLGGWRCSFEECAFSFTGGGTLTFYLHQEWRGKCSSLPPKEENPSWCQCKRQCSSPLTTSH